MNNQSRINLLKEVKSAVNTASFSPTASRIEDAKKAVKSLMSYVESLEAPKKPQKKASKPQKKASKRPSQNEKMLEMLQQFLSEGMTFNEMSQEERLAAGQESASYEADLDKPKAKRRRKTTKKVKKATPQQRVADKQEKAFHGKADSPVTPRQGKRTASVEEARKSAQEVSDKSGATARAKRRAEAIAKAATKEAVASPAPVTSSDDRVASLEAQLAKLMAEHKQLTDTLLVMSTNDVMSTANEVCFSDLPFDPTSTL